jgi:TolB-like protein
MDYLKVGDYRTCNKSVILPKGALPENSQLRKSLRFHSYYATGLIVLATALFGCSRRYHDLPTFSPISLTDYQNKSVGRFKTSVLADQIDHYYRGVDPGPLGITTFVNLDDLHATSSFGRVCAEQLLSELAMRGYEVVELRKSEALEFVEGQGEFMLSQSSAMVKKMHSLGGIIVGTYSASEERVYVNARLVDPRSSLVLSAGSVEMGRTDEIGRLLRRGGSARSQQLERIPVTSSHMVKLPINSYPKDEFSLTKSIPATLPSQ